MVFAQTDNVGFVPGVQNAVDYILQSSLRRFVRLNYGLPGLGESAILTCPRK
jgi:hypothetical protein